MNGRDRENEAQNELQCCIKAKKKNIFISMRQEVDISSWGNV